MQRNFEITILGTSSASPTRTRHPSAQVVRMEGSKFLVDCGEGTQHQLIRYGIRFGSIDHIFISHLHGDHFLGVPGLISTMGLGGRTEPLTVIGPEKLQELLEHIFRVSEVKLPFEINYIKTNPEQHEVVLQNHKWRVETFPLKHRVPCTGFIFGEIGLERRLNRKLCDEIGIPIEKLAKIRSGEGYQGENGKYWSYEELTLPGHKNRRYVYCTDTLYDESIIPWIENADLLYHESTFLDDLKYRAQETFHTTALQAGKIAKLANANKLIIGHFSARYKNTDELFLIPYMNCTAQHCQKLNWN